MISNKQVLAFTVLNHLMLKIQLILRREKNYLSIVSIGKCILPFKAEYEED